jgi:hypothetical protein
LDMRSERANLWKTGGRVERFETVLSFEEDGGLWTEQDSGKSLTQRFVGCSKLRANATNARFCSPSSALILERRTQAGSQEMRHKLSFKTS